MKRGNVKKLKGVFMGILSVACLFKGNIAVYASDLPANGYEVISTNEDLLPENISIQPRVSVTYDHTAGTKSHDRYVYTRYCWGRTQAKQGSINLSSYTRARYESIVLGRVTADSDRQWSEEVGGPSYAESGDVDADIGSQWVAHTYYGITD